MYYDINEWGWDYQLNLLYKENDKEYKNINNSYNSERNNINALIKCFELHENMDYTALKLAKLLLELLKEKINNYYIVIADNEHTCGNFDISNLNSENFYNNDFIRNTYLYYGLFKLAMLAYNNNFKLKIYFTSMENLFNCEHQNKIKDIENFNYIELGTEEQKKYYNDIIIPELKEFSYIDSSYLLYYIFICMLDIKKTDTIRYQITKKLCEVINLME